MNIILQYPAWFILLCLLLGAGYAFALYYKNKRLEDFAPYLIKLLAAVRFVVVSVLAFLLLGPLLKSFQTTDEKPIVIIAQDNSSSLLMNKDSTFYKEEYPKLIGELKNGFEGDFDLRTFSFGERVEDGMDFTYDHKQTDLSELMDELVNRFDRRNVGAVVVASDGIYNKGRNPVYQVSRLGAPVHTIALGDTSLKRDILIKEVNHNRIAYLGNDFPVEMLVQADKLKGKQSELTISRKGNVLFKESLTIEQENYFQTFTAFIEAAEPGIQKYTIQVKTVEGEENLMNNTRDIYIDVLDSRQKVLLLAHAPHPDVAAFRHAISSNKNYEVESMLADEVEASKLSEYSLIVLHQLPSNKHAVANVLSEISNKNLPVLYVLGDKTDFNAFNRLQSGIQVVGFRGQTDDVNVFLHSGFKSFTMPQNSETFFGNVPPIRVPMASWKSSNANQTLFYQKMGRLETDKPLLVFNEVEGRKTAVFSGLGLWRWRIYDYAMNENHETFNTLVNKIVQYLALKEDKSRFKVFADNDFLENEEIIFDAEFYNDAYELINNPDVLIRIYDEEGNEYTFSFNRTMNAYRLNAGMLPPGNYTYRAEVDFDDDDFSKEGSFSVSPVMLEAVNTIANHNLLYQMAENSGGSFFLPSELESLKEVIRSDDDIVTITYSNKVLSELLNHKWIFFLLLIFLSMEWFIRKRSGVY